MPPSSDTTESRGTVFSSRKSEHPAQRLAPAEADLHVRPQQPRDIVARRRRDHRACVAAGVRQRRDDDFGDAEPLLRLDFQPRELGDLAGERDAHVVHRARFGEQPHHGDAADAERVGDGALRHLLDVVHPGDALAQTRRAPSARAATRFLVAFVETHVRSAFLRCAAAKRPLSIRVVESPARVDAPSLSIRACLARPELAK